MSPGAESVRWTVRRWLFVIALFAAAQIGLIYLLSEKTAPAKAKSVRTSVRLLTQPLSEREAITTIAAGDPTVFVLANAKGFSGAAWLDMPTQDYSIADWDEPPRWLNLKVEQLGSVFTNFLRGVTDQTVQIAEKIAPVVIIPEEGPRTPTASRFVIEGDLNRRVFAAPTLPVWPHTDILRNSVVQVSVNGLGEVVLARLLGRSGLPAADQKAVSLARELMFKPINYGNGATNLISGTVIFQWETVPAPEFE